MMQAKRVLQRKSLVSRRAFEGPTRGSIRDNGIFTGSAGHQQRLERLKLCNRLMKPTCPLVARPVRRCCEEKEFEATRMPRTDYCLQSGFDFSRGFPSPYDDGRRAFHNLGREFLTESAREQKRDFIALALILLTSAWPVISMVATVVHVYTTRHP